MKLKRDSEYIQLGDGAYAKVLFNQQAIEKLAKGIAIIKINAC